VTCTLCMVANARYSSKAFVVVFLEERLLRSCASNDTGHARGKGGSMQGERTTTGGFSVPLPTCLGR
jgi:hypothetical protein